MLESFYSPEQLSFLKKKRELEQQTKTANPNTLTPNAPEAPTAGLPRGIDGQQVNNGREYAKSVDSIQTAGAIGSEISPSVELPTGNKMNKTNLPKETTKGPDANGIISAGMSLYAFGNQMTAKSTIDDSGDFARQKVDESSMITTGIGSGATAGAAAGSVIPGLGTLAGGAIGAGIGGIASILNAKRDKKRAKKADIRRGEKFYAKTQEEREQNQKIQDGMDVLNTESSILKSQLGYNLKY